MPGTRHFAITFAVCCFGIALFSSMDAVMKGLSLGIGLLGALFWRSIAGSIIGLVLMIAGRQPWPGPKSLRLHMLRGTVLAGMASLFFWAVMRMPLAEGIALSFISPLIALYLAAVLLGERIGRQAVAASLLGLVGVMVILSGRMAGNYDPDALMGAGAVLASAVLYAWNLVLQRQQAQIASPIEIAFFQNVVMLGVFGLVALGTGNVPPVPSLHMWTLVLGAAGMAFVSFALLAWCYARAEAQYLIPVEYTAFLWAALIGAIAFGERLTPTTIGGAILIVAACLIASRTERCELKESIA